MSVPFELESMSHAVRYQDWLIDTVSPFLGERILEVGSGIGTMTRHLAAIAPTVATDIDDGLLVQLRERSAAWEMPPTGIFNYDIDADPKDADWLGGVDTVISFNVLEHIPDDRGAVRGMVDALRAAGATGPRRLIIFVPAHQWAYGAIDRTFDHYRRYSAGALREVVRSALGPRAKPRMRYFNTIGLAGWVTMGRILQRPTFGLGSVKAMEHVIPGYRKLDTLLHHRVGLPLGQSLLCVADVT